jgi:hypothetical protein
MSERAWARVGQIGTALAGITAVIAIIISANAPSSRLLAEIRPMAFRLPVTADQLVRLTGNPSKPLGPRHCSHYGSFNAGKSCREPS